MRILRGREVDQAIGAVLREVKAAVKQMNTEAGKLMARGKYDRATLMVESCRRIGGFQDKVSALRKDWRILRKGGQASAERQGTTPVWRFYKPVALALIQLQGQAKRKELEQQLETQLSGQLLPGDLVPTSRGVPKWKISVRRAQRPLVKEGFVELARGGWWRLTEAGRRMAEQPEVPAALTSA